MELAVQIVNFGSAWWVRPGSDVRDPERYARHAAYFNSTGIESGTKIHTDGPVHGLMRFNANSGLNPHRTLDNIGSIFCCTAIERYRNTNRLLALRRLPDGTVPTHFLIKMHSLLHGVVAFNQRRSLENVAVLSASRFRGKQELLLLLTLDSSLYTSLGEWRLSLPERGLPRLMLCGTGELHTPEESRE